MTLRYVNCELPSGLEKSVVDFEDFFDLNIQPYFDQLDALNKQHAGVLNALNDQIYLRNELLNGAPANGLGSLADVEKSTGLTNPERDGSDLDTKRLDEIKLGAAGIAMINGKFFVILNGTRIQALRYLWECAGGNYQAFIAMGNAVTSSQTGSHMFFEYNPVTERFPFQGKAFTDLKDLSGYHNSLFHYRLFWNTEITPSYYNRSKLESYGFTDDQIISIFNQRNPNDSYDFPTQMSLVSSYLKGYVKLMYLNPNDPLRIPMWKNEVVSMSNAIKAFLDWRFNRYMTSAIIDPTYWVSVVNTLTKDDLVEVMEHRPDILDMDVAPSFDTVQKLIEKAMTLATGSTVINTYLQNIHKSEVTPTELTALDSLQNAATALWKDVKNDNAVYASNLEQLIQYLTGSLVPLSDASTVVNPALSGDQIKSIFPANVPMTSAEIKTFTSDVGGLLLNTGIKAAGDSDALALEATNNANKNNVANGDAYGSGGTNIQGLPSSETFAMLLGRRMNWNAVGVSCYGTDKVVRADPSSDLGTTVKTVNTQTGVSTAAETTPSSYSYNAQGSSTTAANNITGPIDPAPSNDGHLSPNSLSAKDRNKVQNTSNAPANTNSFGGNFNLTCSLGLLDEFGRRIDALMAKLEAWLIPIIEALKEVIIHIQDKIDSFIVAFQRILDTIISKLEKLLTLDLNLAGGLGIDNSLIKCAWNMDFGLKIDLLSILLKLLSTFFPLIGSAIQDYMNLFNDFINKIFCIPINFINGCLGNATLNKILSNLGCTIKDIPLPEAILSLLQLLQGLFDLRSIVLRKASGDWLDLAFSTSKQPNNFKKLSIFGSMCAAPPVTHVLDNLVDAVGQNTSQPMAGPDARSIAASSIGATA